jgi:hypothetical protein
MFMRYFHLVILATTAASALSQSAPESTDMARQLGDFDWAIQPEDGFPQIAFNSSNEDSEVIFKYNFTGIITDSKFFEVNLYKNDCITDGGASLSFVNSTTSDELDIDVDIKQETISTSPYYQSINDGQAAIIGFCLRVDYNRVIDGVTESVNFYETNVTINVDLTANFTLTEIIAERTAADNEAADAALNYPVEAYICLDDNSEVADPDPLFQGSVLQVCIKIDDTVVNDNIMVEDILTFVISQPTTETSNSVPINNAVANALTEKLCRESGICNVKTQLQSKFFTDTNPPDLRVDGVAILAFGKASLMPSSAPTDARRRLRVPIQGLLTGDDVKAFMAAQQQRQQDSNEAAIVSVAADSSQRRLDDGGDESEFGLQVGLQGINGDSSSQDSSNSGGSAIVVAVIVLIMLAAGCGLGFFFCTKRRTRKEEIDVNKHHQHHSSATSVGTYPSQGSAYTSSSSGQYANYPSQGSGYSSSSGHGTLDAHFD